MFALLERAVGDLAQQAGVVVQGADIAPVDLVGWVSKWSSLRAFRRSSIASIWNLVVMKASRALSLSSRGGWSWRFSVGELHGVAEFDLQVEHDTRSF
jgi:hypothetical protein